MPTVHWNGGDNRPLHSAARRQGCTCKGERPEGKFQQRQHHRKGQLHHAFRDKGGETLSGNINYKVYLGDQKKEGTAAGKTVQLDATLPEGRCKIVVTTSNAKGESERTATSLWICRPGKRNVQGSETARHQDYEREHHRYRALRQWRV